MEELVFIAYQNEQQVLEVGEKENYLSKRTTMRTTPILTN